MATNDFSQVITEARAALDQMVKGDAEGYVALFSRGEDITLGNPFGGFGRGREAVLEQLQRAASYYRDGEIIGFETISQLVTPELAYTVEIERVKTKVNGRPEVSEIAVRTTCVYRREEAGWKLLHRHADPRVSRQSAESVLESSS